MLRQFEFTVIKMVKLNQLLKRVSSSPVLNPPILLELTAFGIKQMQGDLKITFSFGFKSVTYVIELENVLKKSVYLLLIILYTGISFILAIKGGSIITHTICPCVFLLSQGLVSCKHTLAIFTKSLYFMNK